MTNFEVYGPEEIPFSQQRNIKRINQDNTKNFLANLVEKGISKKQGCYIFCLRAGLGFRPWYVGKATKGIHQECMQDGKIRRYNEVLHDGKKKRTGPGRTMYTMVEVAEYFGVSRTTVGRELKGWAAVHCAT